ncbi:hypothetical protein ACTFOB_25480 [Bacillus cereus group sp. MYBK79-1]|uniref:hypothetical protein n=1 Tax=Bacillus cereus group TaxID=86661 RepID=UPI000BFB430B|nr:hypothetical protein [Bacillus wiedmannii]PHC86063.1 hypothetical protein COF42_17275 [Bacillus wiedmannii]
MSYTVKKSVTERYDIKVPNTGNWAVINISDDGFFNVQADGGDFSYRWGAFGDCFKTFLIGLGRDCEAYAQGYLYSKISRDSLTDAVNISKTIDPYIKTILFKRYNRDIDEDLARDAFDALNSIDDKCSQDHFYHTVMCNSYLMEVFDSEEFIYGLCDTDFGQGGIYFHDDYGCERFCREIMPIFAEVLKEEVKIPVKN